MIRRTGIAALVLSFTMLASGCSPSRMQDRYDRLLPPEANPSSVLVADLARSRLAAEQGTTEALRETAASDAILFAPGTVGAGDPSSANSSQPLTGWAPHAVYVSCDGSLAVTTGAIDVGGTPGEYTTIWRREGSRSNARYRWILTDHSDRAALLETPEFVSTRIATCEGVPPAAPASAPLDPAREGRGTSDDRSLRYEWSARVDGGRSLIVELWDGTNYESAVVNERPAR